MQTSKPTVVAIRIFSVIGFILGFCLAFFGLIGFIIELSSDFSDNGIFLALAFLSIAAFLLIVSVKTSQRIDRFRRYIFLITHCNMTSIQQLASGTSKPKDFVKADLQRMIDNRYFINAYIDQKTGRIVFSGMAVPPMPPVPVQQIPPAKPPKLEIYTCSGCGASGTKPKGTLIRCEYCGSPNK